MRRRLAPRRCVGGHSPRGRPAPSLTHCQRGAHLARRVAQSHRAVEAVRGVVGGERGLKATRNAQRMAECIQAREKEGGRGGAPPSRCAHVRGGRHHLGRRVDGVS